MPANPTVQGGPAVNHLALLVNVNGESIAIPPGATLIFVVGKNKTAIPVILAKVDSDRLIFQCGCRRAGCTRRFIWRKVEATGHHPMPVPD